MLRQREGMDSRTAARPGKVLAILLSWILVAMVGVCLVVYASRTPAEPGCTNTAAKLTNGWCAKCDVGWVANVRIKSKMLYEALDAHGHDINPASIECQSCQRALATDGFCERCRMGFVDQKLYFSPLTYYLARGQACDPAKITCRSCRKAARSHGWCTACDKGMVGNFAYTDKADYEHACEEYDLLIKAVAKSEECELCGAALFYGARCRICKIDYASYRASQNPR